MAGLILPIASVILGVLGLIFGYIYHVQGNKPDATEIATELREDLEAGSSGSFLRTQNHVVKILDVKVKHSTSWLEDRNEAAQQLAYSFLKGIFVGEAEIVEHFEIPDEPPEIDRLRQHPYYGEAVVDEETNSGTGGFEVEKSEKTYIISVNLYADSIRKGAVTVITTALIVSQMVDDILTGRLQETDHIPSFEDFMSQELGRESVKYPTISTDELSKTDFEPEDNRS